MTLRTVFDATVLITKCSFWHFFIFTQFKCFVSTKKSADIKMAFICLMLLGCT